MSVESSLRGYEGKSVYLAFSGGSDSSAMAHALKRVGSIVTCVYVDHGWGEHGKEWIDVCKRMADRLAFDYIHFSIDSSSVKGEGLEDSSRNGRYGVLASILKKDDVMLTAQHMDDQAETFVIQLLRGGGVAGLSCMPLRRELGCGYLERPWLSVPKREIMEYINKHDIQYISDPSNFCEDMDRNFVRHRVIPVIASHRWTNPSAMIARSADNMQVSMEVEKDWYNMKRDAMLTNGLPDIKRLAAMNNPLISTFMKYWIAENGVKTPSKERLAAITDAIVKGAGVTIQWEGGSISTKKGVISLEGRTAKSHALTCENGWDSCLL